MVGQMRRACVTSWYPGGSTTAARCRTARPVARVSMGLGSSITTRSADAGISSGGIAALNANLMCWSVAGSSITSTGSVIRLPGASTPPSSRLRFSTACAMKVPVSPSSGPGHMDTSAPSSTGTSGCKPAIDRL